MNRFGISQEEIEKFVEEIGDVQRVQMAEKFAVAFIQKVHEHPSDAEILLIADASVRLANAIKSRLQSEQTQGKPDVGSGYAMTTELKTLNFDEGNPPVTGMHVLPNGRWIIDGRYEITIPGTSIQIQKL